MLQDRFTKIMLVVIAVLLAANMMKSKSGATPLLFESAAQAQVTKKTGDYTQTFDVKPVRGYEVTGLKQIIALGDGKTFVVAGPDKFMVYQIDNFNQAAQ